MSVPARLRKFTDLNAVLTAQRLHAKILKVMLNDKKVSKKYRSNISKIMIDFTSDILSELVEAGFYKPETEGLKHNRLMHLDEVLKTIQKLELHLNVIKFTIAKITYTDLETIANLLIVLKKEIIAWQKSTKEIEIKSSK